MNDPLGGHLVDNRDCLTEGGACRFEVVTIGGRSKGLERPTELGPETPIVLASLDILPICLEGRFRTLRHDPCVLSDSDMPNP